MCQHFFTWTAGCHRGLGSPGSGQLWSAPPGCISLAAGVLPRASWVLQRVHQWHLWGLRTGQWWPDGPHICSTLWCSQAPTRGRVGENNDGGWPYLEPKGVPLHCNWAGVFSGCIGSRGNQIFTCLAQTMSWSWKFFQCMCAYRMRGCIANIYNLYSTCTTQAIGHTWENPNEPTSNWSGIPIRVFDRAQRRSSNRSFRSWGNL